MLDEAREAADVNLAHFEHLGENEALARIKVKQRGAARSWRMGELCWISTYLLDFGERPLHGGNPLYNTRGKDKQQQDARSNPEIIDPSHLSERKKPKNRGFLDWARKCT